MPNESPRVGFDFDGVVSNLQDVVCDVVGRVYSLKLTSKDLWAWDFERVLGINLKTAGLWEGIMYSPSLTWHPQAGWAFSRCHELGYIPTVITKRKGELLEWTRSFMDGFARAHLLPIIDVWSLDEAQKRIRSGEEPPLLAHLDDDALKLYNMLPIIRFGGACLLEQPWSKSLNVTRQLTRVRDWEEFIAVVESQQ